MAITNDVKSKHLAGSTWKAKQIVKKGKASQTPGSKKGNTCQLLPVGGYPRKFFMRARSYKDRSYGAWCKFSDAINRA